MIRKVRFDQIFFIDLPDRDERRETFKIHLSQRGVDPFALSLDVIAELTAGWTGTKIEQALIAALVSARLARKTLTDEHMCRRSARSSRTRRS